MCQLVYKTQLTKSPLTCIIHYHTVKRKIPRKFELSSKSSKVIDLGVNRKCICNFLLVISIVTLVVSRTVFKISAHKLENSLFSSPHPFLTRRSGETRKNFWIKLITQKTRGVGLGYSVVKVATVFD